MNWNAFWENYRIINIKTDRDLLYQVGKTVNRQTIDKTQFEILTKDIINKLTLSKKDNLLDLCCGNGILTYELSKVARQVIGIDFSRPYINNASKYKLRKNITYLHHDVRNISKFINTFNDIGINKIIIYDALAYFSKDDLVILLNEFNKINASNLTILLGSVLDQSKKNKFFKTTRQELIFFLKNNILKQKQGLGKWWSKKEIARISDMANFNYRFFKQPEQLHTSHYRMDIKLQKHNEN